MNDNWRAQRAAGGWDRYELPDGDLHVVPVDDYKPHALFPTCWCRPRVDVDTHCMVIHNAMGRREFVTRLH